MGGVRVGIVQRRNGEIGVENLVNKCRVLDQRWVTNRKRGNSGFNEIGMDVFRLIAVLENKILKK